MSGHILITGFEPFEGVPENPSAALLEGLPRLIDGVEVRTAILPVDTEAILGALEALYAACPRGVIHVGVAKDRAYVSLETVAYNERRFVVPDNRGARARGAIVEGGPATLSSRLPDAEILAAWREAGIPSAASDDPGRFLCNQAMYTALSALSAPAGFIHVPPDEGLSAACGIPGLPRAQLTRAVALAAHLLVRNIGMFASVAT